MNEKIDALLFDVVRSVIYHDKRRGFYDGMNKTVKFLVLSLSSATLISAIKLYGAEALPWLAVATAFMSFYDLVFSPSSCYVLHTDLKNRYARLRTQIETAIPCSESDYARFRELYDSIERADPPLKRVLNCISFNEAVDALGHDQADKLPIGAFQKFVAPWFDFMPDAIKPATTHP